ncbi:MAG: hypothetical protein M3004_02325 [Bacteroidota bacterium]|nr:hypothetical protein [Bacteroidota bacterium]
MMKKIKLLLFVLFGMYAFAGVNMAYSFSINKPIANAELPSAVLTNIKVSDFVKLSAKEFSELTGKKMNFFQKLSFKFTKMRMKQDLKKNPDLKLTDYMKANGTFQVDILWLVLGSLVGLGVLFAYITKQEQYKITSAWIGFGIFILLFVLFGRF